MQYSYLFIIALFALTWHLWRELQSSYLRQNMLEEQLEKKIEKQEALNSHFLFNSLNTIRYYVRTNSTTAREMLLDLALVLQTSLRKDEQNSLKEELEAGRAYLRLEQARLGERLTVLDTINDSELDIFVRTRVILTILQSLVNTLSQKASGGTIYMNLKNQTLQFEADGKTTLHPSLVEQSTGIKVDFNDFTTRMEWRYK